MAKVGAQRASELTGRSKSTIQRAMNNGKLSYEVDANGRRLIDVSELDRVFGLDAGGASGDNDEMGSASVERELEKAAAMLESERLKMRVRMLEEQAIMLETQLEDLKQQRDQWQRQASQVLITSQYSQKQAEELKAEMKERERRAQERRKQELERRMQAMQGDNQNAAATDDADQSASETFNFKGFWKRVKGVAS